MRPQRGGARAVLDRAPSDRLQPSLLDRLTDEEPDVSQEAADRGILSIDQLRDSVRRDLTWLLNATCLESTVQLSEYPEVERSTLNFGIPDMTGKSVSTIDRAAVARRLRRAIWDFEPRLLRESVQVRPAQRTRGLSPSTLCFVMEAELWCEPTPIKLLLRTELNLESGEAQVVDAAAE
jgi:type VI secretion system protein ImpF